MPQLKDKDKRKYSALFKKFVNACIMKDGSQRPSAIELLQSDFIATASSGNEMITWIKEIRQGSNNPQKNEECTII